MQSDLSIRLINDRWQLAACFIKSRDCNVKQLLLLLAREAVEGVAVPGSGLFPWLSSLPSFDN